MKKVKERRLMCMSKTAAPVLFTMGSMSMIWFTLSMVYPQYGSCTLIVWFTLSMVGTQYGSHCTQYGSHLVWMALSMAPALSMVSTKYGSRPQRPIDYTNWQSYWVHWCHIYPFGMKGSVEGPQTLCRPVMLLFWGQRSRPLRDLVLECNG